MKIVYPFSYLTILPTVTPSLATIRVIAVTASLISETYSIESDYLGEYTKELHVDVPVNYREVGCTVYAGKWIDLNKCRYEDIHIQQSKGHYIRNHYGYSLCVGTPESFSFMGNVILENVRTADNMLVAYERIMRGEADRLELNAYAHGDVGRMQFNNNRKKYISRGDK